MKKVAIIIQARLTSTRLPGKVLKNIAGYSVIQLIYLRLKKAKSISKIVFAIPRNDNNLVLFKYILNELKADIFTGSEHDVLQRYRQCADAFSADYYVRITADCPFVLPELVDNLVELAIKNKLSYVSNISPPTFADGFDVEVFSKELLYYMDKNFHEAKEREHVTFGFLQRKEELKQLFPSLNYSNQLGNFKNYRLTLDNENDYTAILKLVETFNGNVLNIKEQECIEIYAKENLFKINNPSGIY